MIGGSDIRRVSEMERQQAQADAWPEGVIARYLTVGGATVDLTHDMHYLADAEPNLTIARCRGENCHAHHQELWSHHAYRSDNGSNGANQETGKWAQAHAETCRAMPKPAASR